MAAVRQTENMASMITAAQVGKFHRVKCFTHCLNFPSQQALEVLMLSRLLGRIQNISTFFHRSTTASHSLKEKKENVWASKFTSQSLMSQGQEILGTTTCDLRHLAVSRGKKQRIKPLHSQQNRCVKRTGCCMCIKASEGCFLTDVGREKSNSFSHSSNKCSTPAKHERHHQVH